MLANIQENYAGNFLRGDNGGCGSRNGEGHLRPTAPKPFIGSEGVIDETFLGLVDHSGDAGDVGGTQAYRLRTATGSKVE
jgi:hypothetical protein